MEVEIWMYVDAHGRQRPIRAGDAWAAANRARTGNPTSEDRLLLAAITQFFRRLKSENQKLVIKDVPEFKVR
jgi:hypothetical protein